MSNDPLRQRRRLIGIGFVLAFALSTATLIYTGLNVRAPGTARDAVGADGAARDDDVEAAVPDDAVAATPEEPEEEAAEVGRR